MNKIDISSTAVEKGIDLAKSFVDKLILPSVEEAGLLMKDHVTLWKFKNQVKMLNKAKGYCEKYKIDPKTISLKLLCPLLDYSALEENEGLQDKWAILLGNMVDSTQNIENHVFPYILSQISSNEFIILDNTYDDKILRQNKFRNELEQFSSELPNFKNEINGNIDEQEKKLETKEKEKNTDYTSHRGKWIIEREIEKLKYKLKALDRKENLYLIRIEESQVVPEVELKEFELSNLIRLGLIRYVQQPYANPQTLEIPYQRGDPEEYESTSYTNVEVEIEIDSEDEYVLTELGELFFKACKVK